MRRSGPGRSDEPGRAMHGGEVFENPQQDRAVFRAGRPEPVSRRMMLDRASVPRSAGGIRDADQTSWTNLKS